MIWEEDHMARHVYLTDKHSPIVMPSWFGESIGHYENGDALVVDTIGLNTRTFVDSFRTPHTEQLHVIERFRIVEGGKALEVNVRVEDPGAFTMPWSALQRYRRVEQGPMREAVCAENNANFFNYDVEPNTPSSRISDRLQFPPISPASASAPNGGTQIAVRLSPRFAPGQFQKRARPPSILTV